MVKLLVLGLGVRHDFGQKEGGELRGVGRPAYKETGIPEGIPTQPAITGIKKALLSAVAAPCTRSERPSPSR
ncbi:hypothetical protein [Halomonas colorata]|uniref:hypothetical protein n=1 Tax=Halomonas colorata TaxID=2742615 RepID=UPI0018675F37|nr:hypothetical protein [Halomonas colorata]